MNNPISSVCEEKEASAQECVAFRKNMLRLTSGGWAWSRKLTIRLDGKLVARLHLARDTESPHNNYTLEPGYAVRLVEVWGKTIRTLKVKTANDEFLLRVTEAWMKLPAFEFTSADGNPLVAIDRLLQSAWWRHYFLTSACGSMQIVNCAIYISQQLPIELGIATMLYWDCRVDCAR